MKISTYCLYNIIMSQHHLKMVTKNKTIRHGPFCMQNFCTVLNYIKISKNVQIPLHRQLLHTICVKLKPHTYVFFSLNCKNVVSRYANLKLFCQHVFCVLKTFEMKIFS